MLHPIVAEWLGPFGQLLENPDRHNERVDQCTIEVEDYRRLGLVIIGGIGDSTAPVGPCR